MSQEIPQRPIARKKDLVTRELPDELLVYDLKTHEAHCLNQTAATVWKYCDGKHSVIEIVEKVKSELNLTLGMEAIWLALSILGKANLLEERILLPTGKPQLKRREAIKRLSIGTAVAVPLIMSIVAPTVQAGCTPQRAIGQSCTVDSQCGCACCFTGDKTCQNKKPKQASCTQDSECCSNRCLPSNKCQ